MNQYSQGAQASGTTATGALLTAGGVLPSGILGAAGGAANTTVYAQGPQYLNTSSLGMGKWASPGCAGQMVMAFKQVLIVL